MATKIKTKKMSRTAWNSLDRNVRRSALRYTLGPHFREYMVEDSLQKDFIFWEVILKCVRLLDNPKDKFYKVIVNNTIYVG